MRLFLPCVALFVLASGSLLVPASALDIAHTAHHAKGAHTHLVEPKHAAAHKTQAAAAHAATHTAAGSSAARIAGKAAPHAARKGRLQHANLVSRRHRSYERFTASSFVTSQGEGDITAGEDPPFAPPPSMPLAT